MAKNPAISSYLATVEANAAKSEFNQGYLRIYSSSQPANSDLPITNQTLLAELRFGNPAFDAAVDGVLIARTITDDSSAKGTGKAEWFRCFKSDGVTVLGDGSVGETDDFDIKLNNVNIQKNIVVGISSFKWRVRKK